MFGNKAAESNVTPLEFYGQPLSPTWDHTTVILATAMRTRSVPPDDIFLTFDTGVSRNQEPHYRSQRVGLVSQGHPQN